MKNQKIKKVFSEIPDDVDVDIDVDKDNIHNNQEINNWQIKFYVISYNILALTSGLGGLAFSN